RHRGTAACHPRRARPLLDGDPEGPEEPEDSSSATSGASLKSTLPMCRFIDFIRPQTARAIAAKTTKPRTPGVTLFSSTSWARETRWVMATALALMSGIVADAGKQVVLGEGGIDERLRKLEVLGRPDLPLQVQWDPEPTAVGIDLRGMR